MNAPRYFQHANAWRAAFLALMEYENPTEVPCRGVDNPDGWIYHQHQPPTEPTKCLKTNRPKLQL